MDEFIQLNRHACVSGRASQPRPHPRGKEAELGVMMDWVGLNPIKALFWSAVVNGVIAVPMMFAMMYVVSSKKLMGEFTAGPLLKTLGWASTAVMLAAAVTMFVSSF